MFGSDNEKTDKLYRRQDFFYIEYTVPNSDFWRSIKYCLNCICPLVKILQLVEDNVKPASKLCTGKRADTK